MPSRKRTIAEKYTCPCCGYKTLDEIAPGFPPVYNICGICGWEYYPPNVEDPDWGQGGPNSPLSLRQAQRNFVEIGACSAKMRPYVRRPTQRDQRDSDWKLLEE